MPCQQRGKRLTTRRRKTPLDLISRVNPLSQRFYPKKSTGNRSHYFRLRPPCDYSWRTYSGRPLHDQGQSAERCEVDAPSSSRGPGLHSYLRHVLHRLGRRVRRRQAASLSAGCHNRSAAAIVDLGKRSVYLGLLGALQPQSFPQLHSLLSFMGQFLPLFLQPAGLSAAKETVHIAATKIENRILA